MTLEFKAKIQKFISEFTQEMYRVYLLATPVVIAHLIQVFEKMQTTGSFDINWNYLIAITAIAVLKSLDRGLHESGLALKGLTRN